MADLLGFEIQLRLEMQFSGLELLYLYNAANRHYDSACKATTAKAGDYPGALNGTLTRAAWYLGFAFEDSVPENRTAEEFLFHNQDKTSRIVLSWRELDTLAKVAEGFSWGTLGAGSWEPKEQIVFDKDFAAKLTRSINQALNDAILQMEILQEQEVLRREGNLKT